MADRETVALLEAKLDAGRRQIIDPAFLADAAFITAAREANFLTRSLAQGERRASAGAVLAVPRALGKPAAPEQALA